MTLSEFFEKHPKLAVAFSGGVDSSYLLYAAKAHGCDVKGYFMKTPFQPQFELDDALKLAGQYEIPVDVLHYDPLMHPDVVKNDSQRCYYCKRQLFTQLIAASQKDGYPLMADGTNASDDADDRPGMKALRELGVISPLRDCGLTKPEIRRLSRQAGLFTSDKPAYACLATRIPTGTPITHDTLGAIERSEEALFSLGFSDFRVRTMGSIAKLQLPAEQMEKAVQMRHEIINALNTHFTDILLDLKERQ